MVLLNTAKPLTGITVLVTRAKSQASSLSEHVERLGGRVLECPVIEIAPPDSWAPLDEAIARLERYRWLVITSPNGAEAFASRLGGRSLSHLVTAAVGSATAGALERLGISVGLVPPEFRAAALPGAMAPLLAPGDRILMPRGDLADPGLPENLRKLGAVVDEVVAYRNVPATGDITPVVGALEAGQVDYVTFTSGSTVGNLLQRLGDPSLLGRTRITCIGPETRKVAEAAGLQVHIVPARYTAEALVEAIALDAAR